MKYGLIGEKLGHSYSKLIHESLTNDAYELVELTPAKLPLFLKKRDFIGINVTIPYKEVVMPYLNCIDSAAKEIGSVNTIVNRDGKLYGYNTDHLGFTYLLQQNKVDVTNQKVLILGSGGTSKTVQYVMKQLGAKETLVVSRSNQKRLPHIISYDEVKLHNDVDVVINTTPVGMSPADDATPIDISELQARVAIDVIYNPHRTMFLQQASAIGMKAVGGFSMLVAQAVYASELFHNKKYENSVILHQIQSLLLKQLNIVLIGMPGSGKTSIGRALSELLHKEFVDTDATIEKQSKKQIKQIFQEDGEDHFRSIEQTVILDASKHTNSIISTGGGVIKQVANIQALRKRGIIFYIQRSVEKLHMNDERPLSASMHDNAILFSQREPLYVAYSDYIISNEHSIEDAITQMQEVLNEIISH